MHYSFSQKYSSTFIQQYSKWLQPPCLHPVRTLPYSHTFKCAVMHKNSTKLDGYLFLYIFYKNFLRIYVCVHSIFATSCLPQAKYSKRVLYIGTISATPSSHPILSSTSSYLNTSKTGMELGQKGIRTVRIIIFCFPIICYAVWFVSLMLN
jgi:hypothetical protein